MGDSHISVRDSFGRTMVFKLWLGKTDAKRADNKDWKELLRLIRKSPGPEPEGLNQNPVLTLDFRQAMEFPEGSHPAQLTETNH